MTDVYDCFGCNFKQKNRLAFSDSGIFCEKTLTVAGNHRYYIFAFLIVVIFSLLFKLHHFLKHVQVIRNDL